MLLRIFLCIALLALTVVALTPRQQWSSDSDSDSWIYPGYNGEDGAQNNYAQLNNRRRYSSSSPAFTTNEQYPSNRLYRNRRISYDNSDQRSYSPSFNELDGPRYNRRNRWNSNLKRQAPSAGLSLDKHNRVQMGVSNSMCDDGKSNLTLDWNLSPVNYTCFHPETRFPRNFDAEPRLECESLPPRYVPGHVCMDQGIKYRDLIPTHGDHRPLWPKFGEYMFVPRERWLHNIEHGAIVMLYHPCAYPSEVSRLRAIVRGCVGKHIISPSTHLTPERPLALVAWGCRLLMSSVDDELSMKFIQTRAHRGPEGTYTKEGQYELGLIKSGKSTGNGAKYGYSKVTCDTLDRSRL